MPTLYISGLPEHNFPAFNAEAARLRALAMLPGWEHSQGAHLELHVAHRLGLGILMAKEITS